MGGTKNIFKGVFALSYNAIIVLVVPLMLFKYITEYTVLGVTVGLTEDQYEDITYWVTAFGILICATAFAESSSPKRSRRRAVMAVLAVIFNALYIYMYKFSGASTLDFDFTGDGTFSGYMKLDMTNMVYLWMGMLFLNIIIALFDLIDFTVNHPKEKIEKSNALETTNVTNQAYTYNAQTLDGPNPGYSQPNYGQPNPNQPNNEQPGYNTQQDIHQPRLDQKKQDDDAENEGGN